MQTPSRETRPNTAGGTNPLMLLIAGNPLSALLAIAFGVTWIGVFSQAAALRGLDPVLPPTAAAALAVLGCPLAALLVERATGGIAARNTLLLRYVRWRVSPRWYAVALMVPVTLIVAAAELTHLVRGESMRLVKPTLSPSLILK